MTSLRRSSVESAQCRAVRCPIVGRHFIEEIMMKSRLAAVLVALVWSIDQSQAADAPAAVDAKRMSSADGDAANWLSYGRTYSEQRFSPLTRITAANAKQLGLAWYADLDTNRGQEATPLVIDGVLYTSTAWSLVKAYDAASGKLLWSYDPEVPKELGVEEIGRASCRERGGSTGA